MGRYNPPLRYGSRQDENHFWSQIQRAFFNKKYLTPKEDAFITDLNAKGPRYRLSEKQHRWLSAILRKVDNCIAKNGDARTEGIVK